MPKPKLIMLYGFASSGKTTLAQKFLDDNPSEVVIEGDILIAEIEDWRKKEDQARLAIFERTKDMTKGYLEEGKTVILPYLLTDNTQAQEFEDIAIVTKADFYEVYLELDKEDAITRLLKRGVWGEEGSPRLTEDDLPEINMLYETMIREMDKRENVHVVNSAFGDIESTYQQLLKVIHQK